MTFPGRAFRLRLAQMGLLTVTMSVALLILAACSGGGNAATTSTPATPIPPAALTTVVATAAPASAQAATPAGPQVNISNFNFIPATLTVKAGTTVTWTNHDDTPHTVTSTDKTFGSQAVNTDGQFSYTFTTPGTYNYFCSIHPFMTAKVVVQ